MFQEYTLKKHLWLQVYPDLWQIYWRQETQAEVSQPPGLEHSEWGNLFLSYTKLLWNASLLTVSDIGQRPEGQSVIFCDGELTRIDHHCPV